MGVNREAYVSYRLKKPCRCRSKVLTDMLTRRIQQRVCIDALWYCGLKTLLCIMPDLRTCTGACEVCKWLAAPPSGSDSVPGSTARVFARLLKESE